MKGSSASGRKTVARPRPRAQCAALPYRQASQLEILLVTSRETGRWVIPKGWPMKSRTRREVAILEAVEEAGVERKAAKKPVGAYDYMKILRSGEAQLCRVTVFSLEVTTQRDTWREQGQRSSRWFGWEEAASAVLEPGLARIIRKFAQKSPTGIPADPKDPPEPARGV